MTRERIRQTVAAFLALWLAVSPGAFAAQAAEGRININTAGVKELQELPLIGEARAQAIIRYRQQRGRFQSADELRQIPDIGDKTFQAIKPYLALSGASTLKAAQVDDADVVKVLPTIVTQPGEVRLLTDQDYYPTLQGLIGQAKESIELTMFVFKTTDSSKNRAASLVQDLIAAQRRGVAVSVLLEKSDYDPKLNRDNELVASRLAKGGIKVRFDSEKTTTHTKAVVIDRRYCLVGSHNFTASALSYNHEASLLVDSATLAGSLVEYMASIR